jgi:hypothetical protein
MQRWLWILLAVCISTGVYFTIRYGLQPKPIPIMNPTDFARLDQIGAVTYRALREPVRAERLVLLGSSQKLKDDHEVWTGFVKALVADHEKIIFFNREGWPPIPSNPAWITESFNEDSVRSGEFLKEVRKRLKAGQIILVHDDTLEVTHLVKHSLSRELEKVVQHPVLSISTLPFAVGSQEQDSLQTQCLETGADGQNERRLACAAQKVSRKFHRKKLDPAKIWAVIERHGLKEYLVFIHEP